jgi:formamidopyrimidine-DNA glycosylase
LRHDHIELTLQSGIRLRFNDPRRFGCWLWSATPESHRLLASLGPEPLATEFNGPMLYRASRGKRTPVKSFIMDNHIVVGVGNIYANESLFIAGIDPRKPASKVTKKRYLQLADIIKKVLASAIEQGGTTLKDFVQADGNPGYFAQQLLVYGRAGENCDACLTPIQSVVIRQRNTFYCTTCQR